MNPKAGKAIGGDPSAPWYYIAKGGAIKSFLGGRPVGTLLEAGAGSDVFSKMLAREGRAKQAVCVDQRLVSPESPPRWRRRQRRPKSRA